MNRPTHTLLLPLVILSGCRGVSMPDGKARPTRTGGAGARDKGGVRIPEKEDGKAAKSLVMAGSRFAVDDVVLAKMPLRSGRSETVLKARFGAKRLLAYDVQPTELSITKLEDLPTDSRFLVTRGTFQFSSFMAALHLAHSQHRPLVMSADMIWLIIAQGFTRHLELNRKLARKFFKRKEKTTIRVERDGISSFDWKAVPWASIVAELNDKVRRRTTKKLYDLLVPRFSTTTALELNAYHVNLLKLHENRFNYEVRAVCGIPWIRLEGTPKDYRDLIKKAAELSKYDLRWWIDEILPILKELANAREGKVDGRFWQSIYKSHEHYYRNSINGWVVKLFPYITEADGPLPGSRRCSSACRKRSRRHVRNPFLVDDGAGKRLKLESFPSGLSRLDFRFMDLVHSRQFRLRMLAGFVGVSQDSATMALRPEIGYVVLDRSR